MSALEKFISLLQRLDKKIAPAREIAAAVLPQIEDEFFDRIFVYKIE